MWHAPKKGTQTVLGVLDNNCLLWHIEIYAQKLIAVDKSGVYIAIKCYYSFPCQQMNDLIAFFFCLAIL